MNHNIYKDLFYCLSCWYGCINNRLIDAKIEKKEVIKIRIESIIEFIVS